VVQQLSGQSSFMGVKFTERLAAAIVFLWPTNERQIIDNFYLVVQSFTSPK